MVVSRLDNRWARRGWWLLAAWLLGFPLLHSVLTRVDIVAFELAGSSARAVELLRGVPANEVNGLRWGIRLDFLYLLAYGFGGALLLRNWAAGLSPRVGWVRLCGIAAWGWIVAACLDAIENVAMLSFLSGCSGCHLNGDLAAGSNGAMTVARVAAIAKFALVVFSGTVAVWALVKWRNARRSVVRVSDATASSESASRAQSGGFGEPGGSGEPGGFGEPGRSGEPGAGHNSGHG